MCCILEGIFTYYSVEHIIIWYFHEFYSKEQRKKKKNIFTSQYYSLLISNKLLFEKINLKIYIKIILIATVF